VFENFTEHSVKVMALGNVVAYRQKNPFFGTEHLLIGLMMEKTGVGAKALTEAGATLEDIKNKITELNYDSNIARDISLDKIDLQEAIRSFKSTARFTPRCKSVLKRSVVAAEKSKNEYIYPEHLLLALLDENEGPAFEVLQKMQLDVPALRQIIARMTSEKN